MRSIDAHLATPHCVAALCRETIDATHRDAARDGSAVTLVNIIKLQNQVIERQNTWQILDQQVHTHLKTQLVNRDLPQECHGAVLKQGYGALDAEALDALDPANKPPLVAVVFLFASSRLRAEKKDLKKIL